jgi:hypothetical protein
MKFLNMCKAVALTALLSIAALPAMAQSLTTTYATNNQFAGNTFDLTPSVSMTVNSFDVHLGGNAETTVAIYWRPGTSNGFESTSAGWTLLGTATVTAQGAGNPTPVAIGGLSMTAGQTYGIYVDVQSYPSAAMLYTNGVMPYANADLTITPFYGKGNPAFSGSTFNPRTWNGTVYYTKTQTCASEGYTGTKLEWCKNICERGYTGSTLAMWIRRWTDRYRTLPYCAVK